MNKKQKRVRNSSNSSSFSISDDESPRRKLSRDRKNVEERHITRKHHKHNHKRNKHRIADSFNGDETKSNDKNEKHKEAELIYNVMVKEEPLSEDERGRRSKKRINEHSRLNDDPSRRIDPKHHKEESRSTKEHSRGGSDRIKRLFKDEIQSDIEPEWGKKDIKTEKKEPVKNNAKPDFGLSGKLTEDANTYNGIVIKYSEPPEARKPKRRWRLYPFKGEVSLPVLHIHRQSAYLMGRDRKVADIPIDHPSCSKQHAALQYRLVPFTRSDGSTGRQIKLYVIDLESANGTFLNNQKIETKKYYELKERDVVKFGFSSREYVLLHEHSKDSENDDDVNNDE